MTIIAPSLLAADFAHLADACSSIENSGAAYLHLDIMDGAFVPNFSFGSSLIAAVRPYSKLVFDVHLMINDPIRFIDDFVKAGADIITFHLESCKDPEEVIQAIRAKGVRVGIAISPETPAEKVLPYLNDIDMVLVMTIHPGFGGQVFMQDMLEKVRVIRRNILSQKLCVDVEVDGGLNEKTIGLATEAGANVIVAGSAVFKSPNPSQVISKMKAIGDEHPFFD